MNVMRLLALLSADIDALFEASSEAIASGLEPWSYLESASQLDTKRREYILQAAQMGFTLLGIAQMSKLKPEVVRSIIRAEQQSQV